MYDSAEHAERMGWTREGDELVVCDCGTDMIRTKNGWICTFCWDTIEEVI